MKRNYRAGDAQTLAQEMAYYNHVEGFYDSLADADYERILDTADRVAAPAAILEIGCGSGAFGLRLQKRFGSTTNVGPDVSLNLLNQHPFLPVLGNGQSLPFADQSFDLVGACAALHHIHNLEHTLSEVFRCLKPAGHVIFVEPNADHPYRRVVVDGGFLRDWFLKTSDESIFPTDLLTMMNAIGFKQTSFRYSTFQNRQPSLLGRMQWWIARPRWHRTLERFVHPWFVLVSER